MPFTYATAINCIDGRIQLPVIHWIKNNFGVDHVDNITEAGPNRVLAQQVEPNLTNVKYNLGISVFGHGSRVVTLSGHHDCARNPVPRDTQIAQVMEGIKTLKSWDFPVRIIGLYINEDWEVEVLYDSDAEPMPLPA
ncbi:MAG: carbonic anhydrase [Syntrophales bacterium]